MLQRLLITASVLALSACVASDPNWQTGTARNDLDSLDTLWPKSAEIDPDFVPAVEVFSETGPADWDGARTVRGVWVAHPKADRTRKVRIINRATGARIDGVLYRSEREETDQRVTLSSDAATALNLTPGKSDQITIVGLRPKGQASQRQRNTVESRAETELASHISRLTDTQLLQVSAAAMRGMGYATIFEDALIAGLLSGIRAFPRPDQGLNLPAIRVAVRPRSADPMTAEELSQLQQKITGSGDLGAVISIAGFQPDIRSGLSPKGAHLELVDLGGLMNIWTTYYEQLSQPDRDLLPLQPVYFLATSSQ